MIDVCSYELMIWLSFGQMFVLVLVSITSYPHTPTNPVRKRLKRLFVPNPLTDTGYDGLALLAPFRVFPSNPSNSALTPFSSFLAGNPWNGFLYIKRRYARRAGVSYPAALHFGETPYILHKWPRNRLQPNTWYKATMVSVLP